MGVLGKKDRTSLHSVRKNIIVESISLHLSRVPLLLHLPVLSSCLCLLFFQCILPLIIAFPYRSDLRR